MSRFVPLSQVVAELGLDRRQTRDRLHRCGIRPHKVRVGGTDGPVVLSLTPDEAACLRAGGSAPVQEVGSACVIRLVPEFDPRRVRVEYTDDSSTLLAELREGAPTAAVLKAWPCRPEWAAAALACLRQGCRTFLGDVLECDDVDAIVARGNRLFDLLPTPEPVPAPVPNWVPPAFESAGLPPNGSPLRRRRRGGGRAG